ncbi:MFS transporter [Actinoallomurus soli]|uniref:MFS transporter n=1 Tax=Actinoallomurus soli TaxID=2952535 RepID=UPI0020929459|nr:MFS transporter [Actinoallomurus soli]MCO5968558.1 MFS transporter [Actinoallomurus soli]
MTTAAPAEARAPGHGADAPMSHRQIMEALSGLLLGLFVAILSSTVVSNALPTITADLHASQTAYTWVITATLLATTISTPIWGKLADLMSKKLLIQLGLLVYVAGSAIAGLSQNPGMLITARVVQGLGAGGLTALAQTIMAVMIAPRERGRYSGYMGAVFALATIGGPLIGGVIVDTSWLGWRWCFYVGVPFAVIALIVLQKTLHLPDRKRQVKVDWLGATLLTASVSLLLIWVSFAGTKYDWLSWQTAVMVIGALVIAAIFVFAESKAAEPILPLPLFRNPTMSLAVVASLFIGVAMFGATTFLSQYFQLARGDSPTKAGLMTLPMIAGLALASTIAGRIISRTGRYKGFMVAGGILMTAGYGLMSMLRHDTAYWEVSIFMFFIGVGLGTTMQNTVLAVQNQVRNDQMGAASSSVSLFRTLGGAMGVSALGALLSNRVVHYTADGLARLGIHQAASSGGESIPNLSKLPAPVRAVVEAAFGHGIGNVFLFAAPCAFVALIAILFIKEVPLRTSRLEEQKAEPAPVAEPALVAQAASVAQAAPRGQHARREEWQPAAATAMAGNGNGSYDGRPGATRPFATQPGAAPAVAEAAAAQYGTTASAAPVASLIETPAPLNGNGSPAGGGVIRGYIRGSDGSPVPHAAITLIDIRGRQIGRATARTDGRYEVGTPGSGTYVLIAAAGDHDPQAATLVTGDQPLDYDLVLSGNGGLTGTVRDTNGSAIAGAMVVVTDIRGEVVANGLTGADGGYSFNQVVAGTYTVAVSAEGHRPAALLAEVGGDGVSKVTRQDVELQPGVRIAGTVQARGRGPVEDAHVTLLDAAGNVVAVTTTGPDGRYSFADLTGGQYTVTATGYAPVASSVSLNGHDVDEHDMWLGHTTS